MATAALGALLGGGASAYGQLKQGQDAQAADEYNANIATQNEMATAYEGNVAVAKQQREAGQAIGNMRAQYGASGIDSAQGSALDELQASASNAAFDSAMLKYSYARKAYGYKASSDLDKYQGNQARESSYYSAAGSLLGAGGSALKASGS